MGLLRWWYDWGMWVALLLVAMSIFWILYDSRRKGVVAAAWLGAAIFGGILMLPSFYLVLFTDVTDLIFRTDPIFRQMKLFGYIGVVGFVIGLGSAIYYTLAGGGMAARYFPPLPPPPPYQSPLPPTEAMAPPPPPTAARAPSRVVAPPLDRTRLVGEPPPVQGWLAVRSGPHAGKQLGLSTSARNSIGRDAARCDLVLDDPAASREHARIQWERGQFVLYDLASANGTWVNNRRIQRQPLMDGDVIRIGDTTMVFKSAR